MSNFKYNELKLSMYKILTKIGLSTFVKEKGHSKYSIVSACYNVEKYIDEFVESIVHQSLDFRKNIQLILVDDGSTDSTLVKIKRWASLYPGNIEFIHKENGGVSSARNAGLGLAKNEWVNFADSDDFFDVHAFKNVDNWLNQLDTENDIQMVSLNLFFYYEGREFPVSDTHPLGYRFRGTAPYKLKNIDSLGDFIQLSCSSALMKLESLRSHGLYFDDRQRYAEDAYLINVFLLNEIKSKALFIKDSVYFYRKRGNKTSALDNCWTQKDKFLKTLSLAYLRLIEFSKDHLMYVPQFVQNFIVYDLYWYFVKIVNSNESLFILNQQDKLTFIELIHKILSHIHKDNIINARWFWLYWKVGILWFAHGIELEYQVLYVEAWDMKRKEAKIRFFSVRQSKFPSLEINGDPAKITHKTTAVDDFCGSFFLNQIVCWVSLEEFLPDEPLDFRAEGKFTYIDVPSFGRRRSCTRSEIDEAFGADAWRAQHSWIPFTSKFKDAWLFMDRDTQADDNAEHLYRWTTKHHPEINAYFLLDRSSNDWPRLEADGFNLVAIGSDEHKAAVVDAVRMISSAGDNYAYDYFHTGIPKGMKYVFLQHGVTKDDLSSWLNGKPISLFITTTEPEYKSILDNGSHWRFTDKEVKLLGLPRHDALIKKNRPEKLVAIMPTWRVSLAGPTHNGSEHELNPDFMQSGYAQAWRSFLCSSRLKTTLDRHNFKALFFPHFNVQPYLKQFKLPHWIKGITQKDANYQDIFGRASVMVTDYSSVAFDFAILDKPLLYYQFDFDEVFNQHTHTVQKGYFDYERDGFGNVCYDENSVLDSLEKLLDEGCANPPKYSERVKKTFKFRDGGNCARVFDAIADL